MILSNASTSGKNQIVMDFHIRIVLTTLLKVGNSNLKNMNFLHELFGEIIARAACNVIISYSLNSERLKFHLHLHQEHIRGP